MSAPVRPIAWTPIQAFASRFQLNLAALHTRDPALAQRLRELNPDETYCVRPYEDRVELGVAREEDIVALPNPETPAAARDIAAKLSNPQAPLTGPLLVAGLDQGWLWDMLSKTQFKIASAPGHRPPVYFLSRQLERLWLVMHLQDWRALLSERRFIVLAGEDCVQQLRATLLNDLMLSWPTTSVTIDPSIWPTGVTLDTLRADLADQLDSLRSSLERKIDAIYAGQSAATFAHKLRNQPLRILGITSLYTTFLQHSMRDWLSAMDSLGHTTKMMIEEYDHQHPHQYVYLEAIAEFRPDLILMIDHCRGEFTRMPTHMPCVMWVQDRLPNIFRPAAGEMQGPMDFCIGYGRRDCVNEFEYPRARFMECPVGVNETRFERAASVSDRSIDLISYVSHASATPEQLTEEQIAKQPPHAQQLFVELFNRLFAIYNRGDSVTQEHLLRKITAEAVAAAKVSVPNMQSLVDFVTQKLNNAFFRHQALHWLVDAGYELSLYGNGWEKHPRFAKFARGIADNQTQLAEIYRNSQINLQITPFGSAHQRLFEGLCAGGFFLLRSVTGDDIEPIYTELWQYCCTHNIRDNDEFKARANDRVKALLSRIEDLAGEHPYSQRADFIDGLRSIAQGGNIRTAGTLWPNFSQVAFDRREELILKVKHFLDNPNDRAAVAESMRQRVLSTVTYRGISQRMLNFMADELSNRSVVLEAAA